MTGRVNPLDDWPAEIRSSFAQEFYPIGHRFLLVRAQRSPPFDELVGDLNLPHQTEYELGLIISQDSCSRGMVSTSGARGGDQKTRTELSPALFVVLSLP